MLLQALKPPGLQQHKMQRKLQSSHRSWINDHFFCHAEAALLELGACYSYMAVVTTVVSRVVCPEEHSYHFITLNTYIHTKHHISMASCPPIYEISTCSILEKKKIYKSVFQKLFEMPCSLFSRTLLQTRVILQLKDV